MNEYYFVIINKNNFKKDIINDIIILDDLIKLILKSWLLLFQNHLSFLESKVFPVIICSSPSPNLINENGILHLINEIIKLNSSS